MPDNATGQRFPQVIQARLAVRQPQWSDGFRRAAMLAGGKRRGNVETYADKRYLTMTGNHWEGTPTTIERRDAELAEVHAKYIARPAAKARLKAKKSVPVTTVAEGASKLDDDELRAKARAARLG